MKKLYLLGLLIPVPILLWKFRSPTTPKHKIVYESTLLNERMVLDVPGFIKIEMTRVLGIGTIKVNLDYFNKEQDIELFSECNFLNSGYFELDYDDIWLPFSDRNEESWSGEIDIDHLDWDIEDIMDELMKVYDDKDYTLTKKK